jgi:uncharacterized protein (DUF1501 family)
MRGNELTRRRFLQLAGGALATAGAVNTPMWVRMGPAWAGPAPASGRRLVVMLLNGGNDGINTLIPYTSPDYYARRPTLAYKPEEVLKLPDSGDVGLHPSLPVIQRLYGEKKVAIVQGVGYDDPSLSHFSSMDIWQSGSPTHALSSGWLGRWLDQVPDNGSVLRAVAIGNTLPLALAGEHQSGVAVPSFGGFTFYDGKDTDPASEPYRLHESFLHCAQTELPGETASALLRSDRRTVAAVRAVQGLGSDGAPPPATLADQVAMAVSLLGSELGVQIAFVSLGSFDDHASQKINHAKMLGQVDTAIDRFRTESAKAPNPGDYLLMTFSEFGRRVEEDGSAGTDHGTAAPMFIVGDGVTPGLHGQYPRLDKPALDKNGNLVRTVEFREVYGPVIDRWLGGPGSSEVLHTTSADGLHPVAFLR